MINLKLGLPSLDLLPVDRVQRASELALAEPNAAQTLLQVQLVAHSQIVNGVPERRISTTSSLAMKFFYQTYPSF